MTGLNFLCYDTSSKCDPPLAISKDMEDIVTSLRRLNESDEAMEGSLSAAGQGVDTRAHEVPANVSSLSLLGSPRQPGQTGQTGQTGKVGQTETAEQNTVKGQLLQISSSLVSMRGDLPDW